MSETIRQRLEREARRPPWTLKVEPGDKLSPEEWSFAVFRRASAKELGQRIAREAFARADADREQERLRGWIG